jgi:hypothetical protein
MLLPVCSQAAPGNDPERRFALHVLGFRIDRGAQRLRRAKRRSREPPD